MVTNFLTNVGQIFAVAFWGSVGKKNNYFGFWANFLKHLGNFLFQHLLTLIEIREIWICVWLSKEQIPTLFKTIFALCVTLIIRLKSKRYWLELAPTTQRKIRLKKEQLLKLTFVKLIKFEFAKSATPSFEWSHWVDDLPEHPRWVGLKDFLICFAKIINFIWSTLT